MADDQDREEDSEATIVMQRIPDDLANAIAFQSQRSLDLPVSSLLAISQEDCERASIKHTQPTNQGASPVVRVLMLRHMMPKLTREQVSLGNRILSVFCAPHVQGGVLATILNELYTLTGFEHEIALHDMIVHDVLGTSTPPAHGFVTTMSLPGQRRPMVLSVDASLMSPWLATMLGVPKLAAQRLGPSTPRSFGLMTYTLLRVIDALATIHGAPPFVVPAVHPKDEQVRLCTTSPCVEFVYLVTGETMAGFVRLWVPLAMIDAFEQYKERRLTQGPWKMHLPQGALARVPMEFPVILGVGWLTELELADLSVGDVVFLKEHGFRHDSFDGSDGAGFFELRGQGRVVPISIECVQDDVWYAHILSVHPKQRQGVSKMEEDVVGEHMDVAAPDDETPLLLEEANVCVDVRMGTLTMTVQQLGALSVGQVLAMNASAGVRAELVAHGVVLGSAELVDVEGHLGVRVISLRR